MSRRKKDPSTPKRSRWEKAADRQNARLRRDNPLFVHAGVVERTSAPEQQARVQKIVTDFDDRIAASDAQNVERSAAVRELVAARVAPAELDRLDRKRLDYPRTAVYALEHWQGELALLDAPADGAAAESPRPVRAELEQLVIPALAEEIEAVVAPEERVIVPCGECGWMRGSGTYHPGNCAALRALAWMLGRCADCNASPAGGCAAHVAEVKAIDAGMAPTPVEFPRRAAVAAL